MDQTKMRIACLSKYNDLRMCLCTCIIIHFIHSQYIHSQIMHTEVYTKQMGRQNFVRLDYYTPKSGEMQGKRLLIEHFCGLCQILCKHRYVNLVNRRLDYGQTMLHNANIGLCNAIGTQYVVSVKKHEFCSRIVLMTKLCKLHKSV